MESDFGQAFIESLLAMIGLILLIGVAALLALQIKHHFKHDFIAEETEQQSEILRIEYNFKKNLIFFESKNVNRNLAKLEDQGWILQKRMVVEGEPLALLNLGERELLVSRNFGVISWKKTGN